MESGTKERNSLIVKARQDWVKVSRTDTKLLKLIGAEILEVNDLFHLNARVREGKIPYEYLLYNETFNRSQPDAWWHQARKVYRSCLELGGWWCSGVAPLNHWQEMQWGCFKPLRPRQGKGFDIELCWPTLYVSGGWS